MGFGRGSPRPWCLPGVVQRGPGGGNPSPLMPGGGEPTRDPVSLGVYQFCMSISRSQGVASPSPGGWAEPTLVVALEAGTRVQSVAKRWAWWPAKCCSPQPALHNHPSSGCWAAPWVHHVFQKAPRLPWAWKGRGKHALQNSDGSNLALKQVILAEVAGMCLETSVFLVFLCCYFSWLFRGKISSILLFRG